MNNWQQREQQRLMDGTYKPIPLPLDYPASHYVHLSTAKTEDDYVAYTPSDEYGKRDRQVRLKFGRYLHKTFEQLTDAEIQGHVTALKAALALVDQPAVLCFATDRDMLNRIFETKMCASGSTYESCMYGKFQHDTIRPYHVYADSPDIAVAYVLAGEEIISRSVVSTKDKKWIRLYSRSGGDNDTDCRVLESLLSAAGYREGELEGNRLTRLDTDGVMLPYIDGGSQHIERAGKWWEVVESGGDYVADCTDGTASRVGPVCARRYLLAVCSFPAILTLYTEYPTGKPSRYHVADW